MLVAPLRLLTGPIKREIDLVAIRTNFFDEQVQKNRHCKQLVILGSGLDARTFRLGSLLVDEKGEMGAIGGPRGSCSGLLGASSLVDKIVSRQIRTFEVDFPNILDRKREILPHAGCEFDINYHGRVAFVGYDLTKDPLVMVEEFHQHGHDVAVPTLWLLEECMGRIHADNLQLVLEIINDLSSAQSVFVASWSGANAFGKASTANGVAKSTAATTLEDLGWRTQETWTFGDLLMEKTGAMDVVDESVRFISQRKGI
eukprot:scaffold952_cov249-Pinguiococcus_pyrenoidosus.AAC.11